MAKTAAERQKEYRAKRAFAGEDGNGERRINTWVSTEASLALARLANRYSVTQRDMLERLILAEDKMVLATLGDCDSPEWNAYFMEPVTP